MRTRLPAAIAGVVAVGLALGVSELVALLVDGVPSLVTAVGSLVVPITPPAVKDWAIEVFGTSDKGALAIGTVAITLAVGAVAGVRGRHDRATALGLVVAFTSVGLFAALVQPLASGPLVLIVAVGVGALAWGVLVLAWRLLEAASAPTTGAVPVGDPTDPGVARRRFLGLVGGAGTAAVAAAVGARLGQPSTATAATSSEFALPTPRRILPSPSAAARHRVDGLTPLLVPNEDFYRIDTALSVPRIDASGWTLRVHGMVDRELELTYADLLERVFVEQDVTIACVSNEVGGDLVGNARWLGTPLRALLEEAGVQDGATQVVGRAIDDWTAGFPTEAAMDGRQAMVVVGMNGEPLPPNHGFPARLIVPGLYGYVSATKWLTEIELTTWDGFDAYWVPRGWSKRGPIKTQSRIDVPGDGAQVEAGEVVVAGVAWAPTRGIDRVEVRVDGGAWREAELTEPLSQDAWVQWRTTVAIEAGDHDVQVRAIDGRGGQQPPGPVPPRPDGAEGWHTVRVRA
jgi:DMSO/TMAO reductase YedYZ molybdopterin-dependent catalytic subunit